MAIYNRIMFPSSRSCHGILRARLTVQASSGYVRMQSMNNAGKYHSQLNFEKTSGSIFYANTQKSVSISPSGLVNSSYS
jgi:hypothetical protein